MADPNPRLRMPRDRAYVEFGAVTTVVGHLGLTGMPVAGALELRGPTMRMVRTCAPFGFKIITWTSGCVGGEPLVPHPDTGSANDVFTAFVLATGMPGNTVDGAQILVTAGQYLYTLQSPFTPGVDPLTRGTSPFVSTPAGMNWVDPSNFVKYLIGATPQLASELNLSKIGY
jgi:hypothetical protein